MSFQWPMMLWLLGLLLPAAFWLYTRLLSRRKRLAALYGSLGQLHGPGRKIGPGDGQPGLRRHIPPALFFSGLFILTVSMARPQATLITPRLEGTVILAFDVSGSMAADDLQPTRLEAAKQAALSFLERLPPTVRIGVVAFSDSGFAVQSPTYDQQAVAEAIHRLRPQRGTALAQGIFASLQAADSGSGTPLGVETGLFDNLPNTGPAGQLDSTVIVLLSDGENNMDPNPFEAAEVALDLGVRVYTVGIGSPAGATLNIDSFLIHSQLDEAALQAVAAITGGEYYNAQNSAELQGIYANLAPQLALRPETIEVTALFALASILLLLVGGALSLLWFSRIP